MCTTVVVCLRRKTAHVLSEAIFPKNALFLHTKRRQAAFDIVNHITFAEGNEDEDGRNGNGNGNGAIGRSRAFTGGDPPTHSCDIYPAVFVGLSVIIILSLSDFRRRLGCY